MRKQDFPQITSAWNELFESMMHRHIKQAGQMSSVIPSIPLFEGEKFGVAKGEVPEPENLQEVSATLVLENQIVRTTNLFEFKRKLRDFANDMVASVERGFVSTLERQLSEAGQSVNFKGEPFTWEAYVQVLEKMPLQFDLLGRWVPPTIVLHPEQWPHVQRVIADAERDSEKMRQIRDLLMRKKAEFDDREASRKLVD